MTPLGPREPVTCDRYSGNPTLPAESCVLRSLEKGRGRGKNRAAYPICADCPLGRLRRQKLEAGGWVYDVEEIRKRNQARLKSEVRARRRTVRGEVPADRDNWDG